MFGHHFVSESKNIMTQDLKFAKEKHAIRSNIALESDLFFSDFLMENCIEVDRHFGFISEIVEDCAEVLNAQFVNRWANFESSQIKDSKMAKKGKALSPVVLSSIVQTNANLSGKLAVRMQAEGIFEKAAVDLIDTEAFQIKEDFNVTDQKSQMNQTDDGSNKLLNTHNREEIIELQQQSIMQQRFGEWTKEQITNFAGIVLTAILPQAQDAKGKDIISSSDQSKFQHSKSKNAVYECKVGSSLIATVDQSNRMQSSCGFGSSHIKGLTVARCGGKCKESRTCKGGSSGCSEDDSISGYSRIQNIRFIRKFDNRNFRSDGRTGQMFQDISFVHEQSSMQRGDTSGAAGSGLQQSSGAAEESAPEELSMAKLDYRLAQENVAIMEAQIINIVHAKMRAASAGETDSSTTYGWN
jgi:hypothetical protein